MDILFIEQLIVFTNIGVYDWEHKIKQKLVLDIEIASDNHKSALSDDINDCLNYTEVTEVIINYIERRNFSLIERVAEEIADLLINRFNTHGVRIKIGKCGAVSRAKMVGVCIERGIFPK